MKVLFISSGNRVGISPIIKNQGESLKQAGIELDYYLLYGKGLRGYWKNVLPLRDYLKKHSQDVVHVHYSLSAFVASLAGAKRLVVSLMGSDVKQGKWYKILIRLFAWMFQWEYIIVKSDDMKHSLGMQDVKIIPNGVDCMRFHPLDKTTCRCHLKWDKCKKHILFPSTPKRMEKNFTLLRQALSIRKDNTIEIHVFENVPNEETPIWYNAADVVVMTSLWEGSPNAIKEAMACNVAVVSTDVGDVKWLFGNASGYYLTSFNAEDLAEKIKMAFCFEGKRNGRERIITLGLSNDLVARRIIKIYNSILQ